MRVLWGWAALVASASGLAGCGGDDAPVPGDGGPRDGAAVLDAGIGDGGSTDARAPRDGGGTPVDGSAEDAPSTEDAPSCATDDRPDLAFTDENCDGIDGDAELAIFVMTTGDDANPGTREMPVATIARAIEIASIRIDGTRDVYVAEGTYPELVRLRSGVSIFGGYSDDGTWTRDEANESIITGEDGLAVAGTRLIADVEIQLLTLRPFTSLLFGGGPVYGARFFDNDAEITVRGCAIEPGPAGTPLFGGIDGSDGAPGVDAVLATGGAHGCEPGARGGNGGAGGNALSAYRGGRGGNGSGGIGGFGGLGGSPGVCSGGVVTFAPRVGERGEQGIEAYDAPPAMAAAAPTLDAMAQWTGGGGHAGGSGARGSSGGGGGGGGAGYADASCAGVLGGQGGGGGGGGCPGTGGGAGPEGGASVGIAAVDTALVVEASSFRIGNGANGWRGGNGGAPGAAGRGAAPPATTGIAGGRGADGLRGGAGGGGSGGAGGSSLGVVTRGVAPTLVSNTFTLGTPGTGGAGGTGMFGTAPRGPDGIAMDVLAL